MVKLRTLISAGVAVLFCAGIQPAAAQNRPNITPEMIRQAQAAGFDVEGYIENAQRNSGGENRNVSGLLSPGENATAPKRTESATDRQRQYTDPESEAYESLNNIESAATAPGAKNAAEQPGVPAYRYGSYPAGMGTSGTTGTRPGARSDSNIPDMVFEPDGTMRPLTPAEREAYRTAEKHIKDSVLRNTVFGREMFADKNLTFAPSYNLPTPQNYVLSAGDELFLDIWGQAETNYKLQVSPDGTVRIPDAGVVQVGGMTIAQATGVIRSRMRQVISGLGSGTADLSLSLGNISSIRVNIIGEAYSPGGYTLPSVATLFNALYLAGGVNDIGSLRTVKLVRDGKQVATLDVYEYLVEGKQEVNVGLRDNDLVIIEPYANLVKVTGNVKRPRIYELKKGETADQLLAYCGGFMGEAYKDNLTVARKSGRQRTMHTVPSSDYAAFEMADGDSVAVGHIINLYGNRVTIEGAVWRPGDYELCDSIPTLRQLIARAEGVRGDALPTRAQINRLREDFTWEIIAVDLSALMSGSIADIPLKPEDLVRIPSIGSLREGYTVAVKGEVNTPGTLMWRENMTIEDAIVMAGGLRESASYARIEIARRIKNPTSTEVSDRLADILEFTIEGDMRLSAETAAQPLMPFDEIYIRRSPGYSPQQTVIVNGEVLFGGEYAMTKADYRLSDLVEKSGGFTPEAYARGAYLRRRYTEDKLVKHNTTLDLAERSQTLMGKNIVTTKPKTTDDYYFVGIDLEAALDRPGSSQDVILSQGDILVVPRLDNTVSISGAVLYPNTVTYVDGLSLKKYVSNAGGYAERAAKKKIYIVYANGTTASKASVGSLSIEPGCEIVVPQKPQARRMSAADLMNLSTTALTMATLISTFL